MTSPDQPYAPTGAVPSGASCALHTDRPAEFTCTRCGNFACGSCKHEGEGNALFCNACADYAFGDIPLERRGEIGLPMAVLRTITGVLLQPWVFFSQRSRERSLLPPMLFAVLVQVPGSLLYAVVQSFNLSAQLELLRDNPLFRDNPVFDSDLIERFYSPLGQLTTTAVSLVFYPLFLAIFAGLQWLALWAVGARAAPFRELLRAICYFQATGVLMIAMAPVSLVLGFVSPSLANVVFFPYLLFYAVWLMIALWKVERTDLWRPVAAQGLLLFGCCCAYFGLFAVVMLGVAAAVGAR